MTAKKAFPGMKFGADPELFVLDENGEGTCPTYLEGTKENPEPIKGGALQRDGFAAEFNIDPAESHEEWESNFKLVLKELQKRLPKGHTLAGVPSLTFSEKVWEEAPDDAKILGCTPDFNAWTGQINPVPDGERIPRMRTAAGHLHLGWTDDADMKDDDYRAAAMDLCKQLDWYLGAWSLTKDEDTQRRSLYGKAGAMRFKPYGTEYRVLSNFWVMSPVYRRSVWDRMQTALEQMSKNYLPEYVNGVGFAKYKFNDLLVKSINESKRDKMIENTFRFPVRNI